MPTGKWKVETENSTYVINWLPRTMIRSNHTDEGLRRDNESVPFYSIPFCEVGFPAIFYLNIREDGIETIRRTSPVTAIIKDYDTLES